MRTRLLAALALLPLSISGPAHAASVQRVATEALGSRQGCVVVMDPRNGALLALVNPKVAAATAFPLGSLAKLVTGLASMERGVSDPGRRIRCDGTYGDHRCWRRHGTVNLEEAIAQSCATYFYQQGEGLGASRLREAFRHAGFGARTGSGLPHESAGRLGPVTTRSELLDLAYGDTSLLLATPLQVACFTAALANGGTRYRPHWPGEAGPRIGLLPWTGSVAAVRNGMRRAVLSGTAQAADVPGLAVYAKTGSATQPMATHLRHGWFAGFTPTLAVVVFVKEGTGFDVAAPIARRIFEGTRS